MEPVQIINRLDDNRDVFEGLINGISEAHARWKPSTDAWSIVEVMAHMADEEREDFRTRLHLILTSPRADWPPIDPEGRVVECRYNERDLEDVLADFLLERKKSISWLQALESPDWTVSHTHRVLGRFSAGQMLANWLAHDYFHIRQLTGLHRSYLLKTVEPLSLDYAGSW